jgi:hypothetical protein
VKTKRELYQPTIRHKNIIFLNYFVVVTRKRLFKRRKVPSSLKPNICITEPAVGRKKMSARTNEYIRPSKLQTVMLL